MSISPPSDIILDVTRAADPARVREASAKLGAMAVPGGEDFATTLASIAPKPKSSTPAPSAGNVTGTMLAPPAANSTVAADSAKPAATKAPPAAYKEFEGMVLAELLQSVMPKDGDMFGSGTGGSVWQGLFVQEVGKAVAAKGGVGIAQALMRTASLHAGGTSGASLAGATDALGSKVDDPWSGIAIDAKKSIWSGA